MSSAQLAGKVAVVTGGTGGIGRAISVELASSGCHVAFTFNNDEEGAATLTQEIQSHGVEALSIRSDLAIMESSQQVISKAKEHFGRIDMLVINAAVWMSQSLLTLKIEDFDRIQAINVRSSFLLCQAAAKEMVKQGDGGSIIVITSRGWSRPRPGTSAYAISKAGQHALAHIAAIELAEFGIRVNEVVPGPIETEMNRVLRESAQDFSALTDGILLKRFGLPKDIAKMVLFLVSPDADFITGSSFRVDGGISVP